MEKYYVDINKYPKSKNKYQCLGPCYYPKTKSLHPTALEIITSNDHPFCPVDEWISYNEKTGELEKNITDICSRPTTNENLSNKEIEFNVLTPYIDFNSEQFLKIYYQIYSFENAIEWIYTNNFVPLDTKTRIINSALIAFGENIEIFDNRFINFIIEYLKKRKIRDIYYKVHSFIDINDSNEIILKENKLNKNDFCTERINFIIRTFLNQIEINKFMIKYLIHKKTTWKDIKSHTDMITRTLIEYILNKINLKNV
jgi:hypothetical protein